jgi:hypothetical protein
MGLAWATGRALLTPCVVAIPVTLAVKVSKIAPVALLVHEADAPMA